jgi:DNA-binding FadR family transcriptional regulator
MGLEEGYTSLVEVREILEPEIAALAAQRSRQEQITTMKEAIAVMERSLDDIDTFIEADLDFHLALAEGSQNPVIPLLLDTLVDLLRGLRTQIAQVDGGMARAQQHHKNILAAVEGRDPQAARSAMIEHMQQVRNDSEASFLL